MLWALYISLSALRHRKIAELDALVSSFAHHGGDGDGEQAAASRRPVAPSARSAKKSGANRKRANATQMAAKPRDMASLRMDTPFSPQSIRKHLGAARSAPKWDS